MGLWRVLRSSRKDLECSGSPVGHVLGTTLDQKLVQGVSDYIGRSLFRLKLDADAFLELKKWNAVA